jgi:protein tyrosine phosphatase
LTKEKPNNQKFAIICTKALQKENCMDAIGSSFIPSWPNPDQHNAGLPPKDQQQADEAPRQGEVQTATNAITGLSLKDSLDGTAPKWLESVTAVDKGIVAFCQDLAKRRSLKKQNSNTRFSDMDHVQSICKIANEINSVFVQEIVNNPHFLGKLTQEDVTFILTEQQPHTGILYIEEEWIPTDLTDSCSPKTLYAQLKFSFINTNGSIVDIILAPGKSIESVCEDNSARFLEVDPHLKSNKFFNGFATCNLLLMQVLKVAPSDIYSNAKKIYSLTKTIHEACASVTREELDTVLADDLRRFKNTDRYTNVLPYAINCVETGVEGQDINGSYIRSGNRLFIACQGPSEHTVNAFWQAVVHHGTQTVIALGPSHERQSEKFSDKYFMLDTPLTLKDGTSIRKCGKDTALDWQFSIKKTGRPDTLLNHCIITRTFEIATPGLTKRTVKHLHCPTWQDMMGGDHRILVELIKSIEATPSKSTPIVVHCSAGIGRTGTLIAGYNVHHQFTTHPEKPIAPLATIMEHRHQRYGVVQSREQIEMILRYISELSHMPAEQKM